MRYAAPTLLLILALGAGIYLRAGEPEAGGYIVDNTVDTAAAVWYWTESIGSDGPAAARDSMVREVKGLDPKHRHEVAHTFGTALYRSGGKENLVFCPHDFVYGCFHQVMGLAVSEHGLDVLGELRNICVQTESKTRVCSHAMGHALISFFGYEERNASEAVAMCDRLGSAPREVIPCYDGAFMEFNLREIAAEGGQDIRPYEDADAHALCRDLPDGAKEQCWFQLPFWWRPALTGTLGTGELYAKMGALCERAENDSSRRYCFAGIGFTISWYENFDAEKVATYCDSAAHDRGRVLCVSEAAHNARVNQLPHEVLCNILDGEDRAYCEKFVLRAPEDSLGLDASPPAR